MQRLSPMAQPRPTKRFHRHRRTPQAAREALAAGPQCDACSRLDLLEVVRKREWTAVAATEHGIVREMAPVRHAHGRLARNSRIEAPISSGLASGQAEVWSRTALRLGRWRCAAVAGPPVVHVPCSRSCCVHRTQPADRGSRLGRRTWKRNSATPYVSDPGIAVESRIGGAVSRSASLSPARDRMPSER
jgi:hypothetical protein